MRWNGIKTLVVVGIGVEAGVVQTLRSASNRGYFTVAIADGLAPTDSDGLKEAMRHIANGTLVRTHSELLEIWRDAAPKPILNL